MYFVFLKGYHFLEQLKVTDPETLTPRRTGVLLSHKWLKLDPKVRDW
jgi:hypothetical protein